MTSKNGAAVEVRDLVVSYPVRRALPNNFLRRVRSNEEYSVPALKHVSIEAHPGETLGIVGESGSGKSTLTKALFGLVPISSGSVSIDGISAGGRPIWEIPELSGVAQYIFQDPFSSLNPARSVESSVREPVRRLPNAADLAREALLSVALDPQIDGTKLPSQLSGGQCQRACLARALVSRPRLLVCDEIVSALDVSVQAQVLNLLSVVQAQLGTTVIFVSHDLAVVSLICDRVVVLKDGEIQEVGPTNEILGSPRNPYTRRLVASVPGARRALSGVQHYALGATPPWTDNSFGTELA